MWAEARLWAWRHKYRLASGEWKADVRQGKLEWLKKNKPSDIVFRAIYLVGLEATPRDHFVYWLFSLTVVQFVDILLGKINVLHDS